MADLSPTPPPPALTAVTGTRPRIEPLDPPMVPFVLTGMGVFAVATVILLLAPAPAEWRWTAVAGFVWGIPGLLMMLRHDADRRRRRALSHGEFRET